MVCTPAHGTRIGRRGTACLSKQVLHEQAMLVPLVGIQGHLSLFKSDVKGTRRRQKHGTEQVTVDMHRHAMVVHGLLARVTMVQQALGQPNNIGRE